RSERLPSHAERRTSPDSNQEAKGDDADGPCGYAGFTRRAQCWSGIWPAARTYSQRSGRHRLVRDSESWTGRGEANQSSDPAHVSRATLPQCVGHLVTGQTEYGQEFPAPERGHRSISRI